jgi:hypothetical protein
MSKSGEIAGTAFKKAFAIAVIAISYLVDHIDNIGSRPPDDFAPSKNGFGCFKMVSWELRRIEKQ